MEQGLMAQAAPPKEMPAEKGQEGAGPEELAERFAKIALDPEFAEAIQNAFDQIPNPVNAAGFLLSQLIQQVEGKLGAIKDDVLFADQGPAAVFTGIVLKIAEEAGLEGAATPGTVTSAMNIAMTMLATGEAMAELQEEGQMPSQSVPKGQQGAPMPEQAPQARGLMA